MSELNGKVVNAKGAPVAGAQILWQVADGETPHVLHTRQQGFASAVLFARQFDRQSHALLETARHDDPNTAHGNIANRGRPDQIFVVPRRHRLTGGSESPQFLAGGFKAAARFGRHRQKHLRAGAA